MILTSIFLKNLKDALVNLTWDSPDGGGTTSFKAVFTYPNWSNDAGYPFAVILFTGGEWIAEQNATMQDGMLMSFEIHVCVDYTAIDAQSDSEKREESALRLREASDKLTEWILNPDNFESVLQNPDTAYIGAFAGNYRESVAIRTEYEPELNFDKVVFTFTVVSTVENENTL